VSVRINRTNAERLYVVRRHEEGRGGDDDRAAAAAGEKQGPAPVAAAMLDEVLLLLLHPFNGLFSRITWVSWYQNGTRSSAITEVPNTHSSLDQDFTRPTRVQNLKSLALAIVEIFHIVEAQLPTSYRPITRHVSDSKKTVIFWCPCTVDICRPVSVDYTNSDSVYINFLKNHFIL